MGRFARPAAWRGTSDDEARSALGQRGFGRRFVLRAEIAASGGDVGELDEPPSEDVPAAETDGAGAEASPAE